MRERYVQVLLQYRYIGLILVLLFAGISMAGVFKLSFTSDFRTYFSAQNPQLRAFEDMEQRFSRQDNVYFLITAGTQPIFSEIGLKTLAKITDSGWRLPFAQRVDSLQNFQFTEVEGDELFINDFYSVDELPNDLESLRTTALSHPEIKHKLVSSDGKATAVNVLLNLPKGKSSEASKESVQAARELLQVLQQELDINAPEIVIQLGGSVLSNVTMGEAIQQDIETLLLISYAVMLIIMLLMLKTLSGVFIVTSVIGLSVSITMGIFGWAGYTMTPPTGFVPTAIMTIAVADTIHVLVSYYYYLRQGSNKYTAICQSMKINFSPVFITSITTMIGVLALNTSDSPPYRDMGNMIAVGVMVAWALTVILVPIILMILPIPKHIHKQKKSPLIDHVANLIIRYHKILFVFMTLTVIGSTMLLNRIVITERWHDFFDKSFAIRQTTDAIDDTMKGLHALYFIADSQQADGINDPAYLQQLDNFAQWLSTQPEVVSVTSLASTIKQLNQDLHQGQPSWYRIPDDRESAAQYFFLYELSLPLGLGLETTMTSDRSATRIQAFSRRSDSAAILAIDHRAVAWAQANAPLLNITETTGLDVVFANLTYRNVTAMLEGTAIALIVISLLMIAALRSWRLGLISMVPNLIPALVAYGLWGLLYGRIDTATSVVACLSLGIVVDDTVHFLSKYNYARMQLKASTEEAIRYAFRTVGVALLITSAILVGGFTVMEFSHFMPSRAMGLLLALTIATALVIDFLLLPPLLLLADKRNLRKNEG